ncbi:hypothetical protein [Faecalibacillus intestinalis]|uniref:hypothetical protein n=1 Tax=Faecalibacillus intestinalis TaxID=1982626 RepID=UPI0022E5BB09|nr:hypothetical protein [Faecalibacillus intestinalis]
MNPKFQFYVLNYDHNKNKVVNFDIFNNWHVYNEVLKEVKKYCRSANKYAFTRHRMSGKETYYGFEGLCAAIDFALRDEWSRCEYEIIVDGLFSHSQPKENETKDEKIKRLEKDLNSGEKWDCYQQAIPNIEIIAREVIYQYKQWDKQRKLNKDKEKLNEEKIIKTN